MKKLVRFFSFTLMICFATNILVAQKPSVVKPFGMTADKNKNLLGLTRTPSASDGTWKYWWVTSGLPVVGVKTNAYVEADTSKGSWAITSKPSGSTASISAIKNLKTNVTYDSIGTFVADVEGVYIVSYTAGSKTSIDTIYAGTYLGVGTITDDAFDVTTNPAINCGSTGCHGTISFWGNIVSGWAKTKHATLFKRAITGQIEFESSLDQSNPKLTYAKYRSTCVPCHTTGFNSGPDNAGTNASGFFDLWLANKFTSPDTTYSYGYDLQGKVDASKGTEKMLRYDGSLWTGMTNKMKQLGTIGCEACHGPFVTANHMSKGWALQNMVSREIGICAQCHDSPNNHAVVQQYLKSKHGISEIAKEEIPAWGMTATRSKPQNCIKCHTRDGFMTRNNPHSGTTTFTPFTFADNNGLFTCVMCHQPHTADNKQVRLVTNQSLAVSGLKLTKGGPGQVCMYCHQARRGAVPDGKLPFNLEPYVDGKTGQTLMDTIWVDALASLRYKGKFPSSVTVPTSVQTNPHYGVQADMLFGTSAYEFNDAYKVSISGLETHADLEASCATCHMAKPTAAKGYSLLGYHTYNMSGSINSVDTAIKAENTTGCKPCHGEIKEFKEILALNDYDGDGVIEGVTEEVKGMIKNIEDKVFIAKWGLTKGTKNAETGIQSWTTSTQQYKDALADSTKAKIFFNYNYVQYDRSNGVHNTKYTIHLLSRTMLAAGVANVKQTDEVAPKVFELTQNYPNPFNPSTNVNFTVPKDAPVKIYVYDASGKLVTTLIDSYLMAGKYTATWDGRTGNNSMAASGVYFYKMVSKNFVQTKKMMLMK
jgi:hypothetical protein